MQRSLCQLRLQSYQLVATFYKSLQHKTCRVPGCRMMCSQSQIQYMPCHCNKVSRRLDKACIGTRNNVLVCRQLQTMTLLASASARPSQHTREHSSGPHARHLLEQFLFSNLFINFELQLLPSPWFCCLIYFWAGHNDAVPLFSGAPRTDDTNKSLRTDCSWYRRLAGGAEWSRREATYLRRYGHRPLRTARFIILGRTQGSSKYMAVISVAPGQSAHSHHFILRNLCSVCTIARTIVVSR